MKLFHSLRRRSTLAMAVLMALGGVIFALTDSFGALLIGAFTGTISATSSEVGVFQTVEQAILPQTAPDERRTWLFSIYNTVANFAGALGSLAAGGAAAAQPHPILGVTARLPALRPTQTARRDGKRSASPDCRIQWHRYRASPPFTSRTSVSRTQETQRPLSMLRSAVSSSTPRDFPPNSPMGHLGPPPLLHPHPPPPRPSRGPSRFP